MDDVEPVSALGGCCLPVASAPSPLGGVSGSDLIPFIAAFFGGFWKRSSFPLFPAMLSGRRFSLSPSFSGPPVRVEILIHFNQICWA